MFYLSLVLLLSCGCNNRNSPPPPAGASTDAPEWFIDVAKESGIDFTHINGMSGRLYMVEVLAPGVGLLDYDNDGDLDVYLVQGQFLGTRGSGPGARGTEGVARGSGLAESTPSGDRLYRNDLRIEPGGTRSLRFTDVTQQSGIVARGYGMGVAAGDFDNDGWVDLYLTKFDAPNQLFRNNRDGSFADVSKASGTDHRSWSVSASFLDFDRDGWLDLYVGNYVRYSLATTTPCFGASGASDYCTPDSMPPLPDRLYRNQHDGTFTDVSARARIARDFGPALGVSTADFNGDGWIDIYVANDGKENQLWLNQRNGMFDNTALLAGVALPAGGKAEASMGVDAGDFDSDGDEDLFMTELTGEGSNLFVNDGSGIFDDRSSPSGLGPASTKFTGFGTGWFDFDNDGHLDLLSVNGTVQIIEALRQARDPFPLHQQKLLFRNLGGGRFEDATPRAGAVFKLSEVGRGAAFGDIDNDGDVDVLVGNNNGPTRLLVNQLGSNQHWLGLRLVGAYVAPGFSPASARLKPRATTIPSRDMLGARVEVARKAKGSLWRRARADGSYASANDPRVLAGLGESPEPVTVRVTWPSGRTETWANVPIDRYTTIVEGTGQ